MTIHPQTVIAHKKLLISVKRCGRVKSLLAPFQLQSDYGTAGGDEEDVFNV
jgi:hypothetical protein